MLDHPILTAGEAIALAAAELGLTLTLIQPETAEQKEAV